MGAVMVKCPETGHDIPTGIVTDRKSFGASPVFFARFTARFVGPSMNGLPRKPGCARPRGSEWVLGIMPTMTSLCCV